MLELRINIPVSFSFKVLCSVRALASHISLSAPGSLSAFLHLLISVIRAEGRDGKVRRTTDQYSAGAGVSLSGVGAGWLLGPQVPALGEP